jgi:sec-independent protein translocase protein TatA
MGVGLTSPVHIALVAVVLLLLFGAKRLPELGRSLGGGMREFKDSVSGKPEPSRIPASPMAADAPAAAGVTPAVASTRPDPS